MHGSDDGSHAILGWQLMSISDLLFHCAIIRTLTYISSVMAYCLVISALAQGSLPSSDLNSTCHIKSAWILAFSIMMWELVAGVHRSAMKYMRLSKRAHLFCHRSVPSVHMDVSSKLPTGAGLGSSAAFSTCLAASLLVNAKMIPSSKAFDSSVEGPLQLTAEDKALINRWAFMAEKVIHGRPSGIDNSTSTYGELASTQSNAILSTPSSCC